MPCRGIACLAIPAVGLLVPAAAVRGVLVGSWRAWRRPASLAVLCQGRLPLLHLRRGRPRRPRRYRCPHRRASTRSCRHDRQPHPRRSHLGPDVGSMALGFAGVFVVVAGDLSASGVDRWTYLIPTAGMLCLAAGTVLTSRLGPTEDLLQTITMQSVVTAAVFWHLRSYPGAPRLPRRATSGPRSCDWSCLRALVGYLLSAPSVFCLFFFSGSAKPRRTWSDRQTSKRPASS